MRLVAALVSALLLPLAGCITETPGATSGGGDASGPDTGAATVAPPATMTASETHQDTVGRCEDEGGVTSLPFCAERQLTVVGVLTLDALPVDLVAGNGGIVVQAGADDAWALLAVIRVRGATEDDAKKNLDTQFAWSHTDGSAHFLKAGPVTPAGQLPIDLPAATSTADASYVLTLPRDVLVSLKGRWTNGGAVVAGVTTDAIDLSGTNGGIEIAASVVDVVAETTNGGIAAQVVPTATGAFDLKATNGGISVMVPEDARHGYDVKATAQNGGVEITLRDGDVSGDESSKTFTTRDFTSRAVKTTLTADVTNGGVHVG